jgi:hypothetical protein
MSARLVERCGRGAGFGSTRLFTINTPENVAISCRFGCGLHRHCGANRLSRYFMSAARKIAELLYSLVPELS